MSESSSIDTDGKARSLDQSSIEDHLSEVAQAFHDTHNSLMNEGFLWVVETYGDHLIVSADELFFRVGYSAPDGNFTFTPRAEWVQVGSEWTPLNGKEIEFQFARDALQTEPFSTEGNALKAISMTDTELRVANYMVLFGGRDLEGIASPRVNGDGSLGEFFTKATKFDSPYTELNMVAIDWEHGAAPVDEPQKDDLLGRVDWKTARIDDKGLFVERVLNRRNQYVKFLEELIEEKLIGTSSEPVQRGAKSAKNGEITDWPIMRDSLTVSPMEPRMLGENTLAALKALSQRLPALKSYIGSTGKEVKTTTPEAGGSPAAVVADKSEAAKRLTIELELLELAI